MSHVVSLRLKDDQWNRLKRLARHIDQTPSGAAARLIEEALRMAEFAFIEFRNSPVGRQAYIMGSSLAVWEVMMVARAYQFDPERTAEHLNWPLVKVRAALQYAKAFPEEIQESLDENDSYDFAMVKRMLPQAELFIVEDEAGDVAASTASEDVAPAAR